MEHLPRAQCNLSNFTESLDCATSETSSLSFGTDENRNGEGYSFSSSSISSSCSTDTPPLQEQQQKKKRDQTKKHSSVIRGNEKDSGKVTAY